jgi:mevalonate kinase
MTYQSSGKLLITGEYLVLKGAKALAVPLNLQQTLKIEKTDKPGFNWVSKEKGKTWFEATFYKPLFEVIETNDGKTAEVLIRILKAAMNLNPAFIKKLDDVRVLSNMEFNREWGFGSSSSLISNIAYWAEVDPFELHNKVSKGSGYDVVTARANGPVIFQKKENTYTLNEAKFSPGFKNEIFFVYLGNKQNSNKSVLDFNQKKKSYRSEIKQVSDITYRLKKAQSLEDFEYYVKEHEQIIATVLKQKPIKETIFKNLQGEAKSLGAWGGDFAMITWPYGKKELLKHLDQIKLDTVFEFDELIKQW